MSKTISLTKAVEMTKKAGVGAYPPYVRRRLDEEGITPEEITVGSRTFTMYVETDIKRFIRAEKAALREDTPAEQTNEVTLSDQLTQLVEMMTELKAKVDHIYSDLCTPKVS